MTKPSEIAAEIDNDVIDAREFAEDLLEYVNDHNASLAMAALKYEDHDLACKFIKLEARQAEAGELTDEIREERNRLLDDLQKAREEAEAEDEEEGEENPDDDGDDDDDDDDDGGDDGYDD